MYIINNYSVAVLFCFITMLCWGSWANTQKLTGKKWRFELFYWDYVLGIFLIATLFAFTLGSHGSHGRSFVPDILQAYIKNIFYALLGGIIFNAANILFSAAISITGMSVAFPVGIGIAVLLGVPLNYFFSPTGNPWILFSGVLFIIIAILFDSSAYRKTANQNKRISIKGLYLCVISGLLMGLFYNFVARAMTENFSMPEVGKLTPYTALFFFSAGILFSNFLFNPLLMRYPIEGSRVTFSAYFNGSFRDHSMGILGGIIWCVGMLFSVLAAGQAGFAISYGLGNGAVLIAAFWGIFIWKEFKRATKEINRLLSAMIISFIIGLLLIIFSRII